MRPRPASRSDPDQIAARRAGALPGSVVRKVMHRTLHKTYYVYIMASRPHGVLYVGMTSELPNRTWQHREHLREGFTKRYWVDRLVYFEAHTDARIAARRERAIKRWRRAWKIALIEKDNPTWRDLFAEVLAAEGFEC